MHDLEIKNFVVDWFAKNTSMSKDYLKKSLDSDYLHQGWVDSFKFISFISEAEERFGIAFDNADFQKEEFAKMSGLIGIIQSKKK